MLSYYVEYLPNGYVLILDRVSGLKGLFNDDGSHRSGGLRMAPERVLELMGW